MSDIISILQHAKKVVSDSQGLVDFAILLVFFVLTAVTCPVGKRCFWGNSNYRRIVLGLVEMTCGLVHAIYSLPKWQVVKLTFFAACFMSIIQQMISPNEQTTLSLPTVYNFP